MYAFICISLLLSLCIYIYIICVIYAVYIYVYMCRYLGELLSLRPAPSQPPTLGERSEARRLRLPPPALSKPKSLGGSRKWIHPRACVDMAIMLNIDADVDID